MVRTPKRVAKVSMLYLRSPSTSGKSFVMAITVAKTVTKHVTNLHDQEPTSLIQAVHLFRVRLVSEPYPDTTVSTILKSEHIPLPSPH